MVIATPPPNGAARMDDKGTMMTLRFGLASIAALSLLAASPAFAFQVTSSPVNSDGSARFADPDDALSKPFAALMPGFSSQDDRATEHGAMITYDLSAKPRGKARAAKAHASLDTVFTRPADPEFNPFLSDGSGEREARTASR
jgi:hypothetical protein